MAVYLFFVMFVPERF
ncbi:MAG: potassium-transporting ATPase subunit F [Elainella sp.]